MRRVIWGWGLLILLYPVAVWAEPGGGGAVEVQRIEQELQQLQEENAKIRTQMEVLQQKLSDLQQQNNQKTTELEKKVKAVHDTAASHVGETLDSYWGEHRFLVTGNANVQYHWAGHGEEHSFLAELEPLFLYRMSDRLLFEAELEVELPDDAETEVNLEYAHFSYLLNDYITILGGKYLLPFGEYNERIQPPWINKLVSNPLLFRHEIGLIPFSEIGAQVRGGIPLSNDGIDLEYALYVANGPRFTSEARGAALEAANNVDFNKNKAIGGRIGFRPLPFSSNLGRLKLGASTYHGKWDDKGDQWVHIWGVDSAYQTGPLELRGEYANMLRELPGGQSSEHREGWYVQAAYKLSQIALPFINRTELVFRYSQQRQPFDHDSEEREFVRGQQYSLGYNYWLTPSTVWKFEYDFDDKKGVRNNSELYTQFVVGF